MNESFIGLFFLALSVALPAGAAEKSGAPVVKPGSSFIADTAVTKKQLAQGKAEKQKRAEAQAKLKAAKAAKAKAKADKAKAKAKGDALGKK